MPPERPASAVRHVGRDAPPPFPLAVHYDGSFQDRRGRGRMKKKVWLKRVAVTAALGFLLFAFGWVPYFLAGMGTTRRFQFPDRENGGLPPATVPRRSQGG